MSSSVARPQRLSRRPLMVAVVLGTALSALAPAGSLAAETRESAAQAVADMSRYCTTCWRNARLHPDSWSDCTQEVFQRMLERVSPQDWPQALGGEGEERREFLRAIDAVKKRSQRSRKWAPGLVEQAPDLRHPREAVRAEDWDAVWHTADQMLSPRQQRILRLSREGWSVQEIADELAVGPERVSDEKYKAIRRLREHLADSVT
jgi:RNA polymerase sigma factor (sigma-70 family)